MTQKTADLECTQTALTAERAKIDKQLDAMTALDPSAAEIVRRADQILADHEAKMASLRARRDAIDERFDVDKRQREAEAVRQRKAARLAKERELVEQHDVFLRAIGAAEAALRSCVCHLNGAFAANAGEREIANELLEGARIPEATALSATDLASRLGGEVMAVLSLVKPPGSPQGQSHRIGSLVLHVSGLYPPGKSWVEREEAATAPAIQALLEHGKG